MIQLHILPLFIGTSEMLLIAGVALLLFGGKKIPEVMRGLGQGMREFKTAANEISEPLNEVRNEATKTVNDAVEKIEKQ